LNKINISKLGEQTREAQLARGIRQDTAWNNYLTTIESIVKRHMEHGKEEFDHNIVSKFMCEQEKRMNSGEITFYMYRKYKRGADRLTEMYEKGFLEGTCPGKPSKFVLNDFYEQLVADFLKERNWHQNTCEDVRWTARKFFFWLLQNSFEDLTNVGAKEIQGFIVHCSDTMRISGVHNIKLYIRHSLPTQPKSSQQRYSLPEKLRRFKLTKRPSTS